MRPVPAWVGQVVLPWHGETYTDFWGPFEATVDGRTVTGTLVLSTYRILFLRAGAGSLANASLLYSSPLNQLHRIAGEHRTYEGRLIIDHLVLSFRETTPESAEQNVSAMVATLTAARQSRLAELHPPPSPPPPAPSPVVQREVVREIVKVPCRFCGTLIEVTAAKCASCGAALRAS